MEDFYKGHYNLDRNVELILKKFLKLDKGGIYIEAGANDGITQSNTYFLSKKYKWKGLLVEPLPNKFVELCKNRKDDICENYALVPFEYKKPDINIHYANLMSVINIENCDLNLDDHLKRGNKWIKENDPHKNKIIKVNAINLQFLLDKHKINHINFFSLDVEGNEINVLKGIDFKKIKFDFILIECRDKNKIDKYLEQFDYKCINDEFLSIRELDFLYINKNLLS